MASNWIFGSVFVTHVVAPGKNVTTKLFVLPNPIRDFYEIANDEKSL